MAGGATNGPGQRRAAATARAAPRRTPAPPATRASTYSSSMPARRPREVRRSSAAWPCRGGRPAPPPSPERSRAPNPRCRQRRAQRRARSWVAGRAARPWPAALPVPVRAARRPWPEHSRSVTPCARTPRPGHAGNHLSLPVPVSVGSDGTTYYTKASLTISSPRGRFSTTLRQGECIGPAAMLLTTQPLQQGAEHASRYRRYAHAAAPAPSGRARHRVASNREDRHRPPADRGRGLPGEPSISRARPRSPIRSCSSTTSVRWSIAR